MSDFLLLCIILLLLLTLLVTLVGFALYSGLGYKITVRTGSPPIRNITFAYKFKQGPYKNCGVLFTESCSIGPKLHSIGVFYDDPKQVAPEKCRFAVGSILCHGEEKPSEELIQLYQKYGYKIFSFPEISTAVTTTFPFTTFLSIFLAVRWVYGALAAYIEERKLCAHPFLEIYYGEQIHYMCPLSQQSDFYVPEAKEIESKPNYEQDVDAGHESAGDTGSLSDTASLNRAEPSDNRESSVTPAVMQSTETPPSIPVSSDLEEENHPSEHSCSESGGSSSSFEELDLEVNEGKKSEAVASDDSIQEADPSNEMKEDKEVIQKENEE